MADLGTAVIPQTVAVLPEAEVSTDYTFRRFNYGAATQPISIGTTVDVETSTDYTFRRYNYGIAVSTYPLLAFPRGTNPAL